MKKNETVFRPIATCDVELPVLEREGSLDDPAGEFPRVLLQAAGTQAHSRRLLVLSAVFLGLAAVLVALLLRMDSSPLVVYQDPPCETLIEDAR